MNKLTFSAAVIATATLASTTLAQGVGAGIGRVTRDGIDLEAATTNVQHLGIAYANGLAYVSARGGNGGITTPPHSIYAIDVATGTVVLEADQPAGSNATVWGFRDGDSDSRVPGVTNPVLMYGNDNGIFVVDPATMGAPGQPRQAIQLALQIEAANGPQPLTANPIAGPGLAIIANYRGVAYDPNGNGGNGSFWTANFASDLLEIDLQGNVLNQFVNQPAPDDWSVYGLALDPITGNLWTNSAPNAGQIAEIDTTTGLLTGRVMPKATAANTQGGLDIVPGGLDGRNCGFDLIALDQGAPDFIAGYRLHLWNNYTNDMEVDLQIGFGGTGVVGGDVQVPLSATSLDYDLVSASGMPVPAAFFIDAGAAAMMDRPAGPLIPGTTLFQSLWEFRRSFNGIIFNGVGQVGVPQSLPITVGGPGTPGLSGEFAIQAVTVDFNVVDPNCGTSLGLAVTPQRRWTLNPNPPCGIDAQALGANSFNADSTSGFFSVTNNSTADITEMSFSWVGSPNPAQSSMQFDTDQGGMTDAFWNGNAAAPGCAGTYRNGTDILTGLDYSNAGGLNLVSACAIAPENSGCEGADPTATANGFQTLIWRFATFTPGQSFEVDIDTDGGAGIGGAQMDGMIVNITLSDGRTCQGVLAIDPATPDRAAVSF